MAYLLVQHFSSILFTCYFEITLIPKEKKKKKRTFLYVWNHLISQTFTSAFLFSNYIYLRKNQIKEKDFWNEQSTKHQNIK